MYCNRCGKVIQDDANLCAYCGQRVGAVAPRKLVRPRLGRKIAGVAMGFAEYCNADVTLVRIIWLFAAILTFPLGIVGYVIAWIVMPEEPELLPAAPSGAQVRAQQT